MFEQKQYPLQEYRYIIYFDFEFSDGPPHSPGYYRYDDVQLVPKPYEGQSLYSYLDSRNYDTGAQLDKVMAFLKSTET